MKLNNSDYDQASFPHKRVVISLLWLRSKSFTPDALRVSYRDMLFVYLEHYYSEAMTKIKSKLISVRSKLTSGRG